MEPGTHYKIVGLAVLILTAGLILAGLWLSIGFDTKQYHPYLVYMHESVSGLSNESPVKYNGVKVGQVQHISLSQIDPQKVRIKISIKEGTPITTCTYATLITQGITGNTYLGLSSTSAKYIPLEKTPGEPYPVIPSKPSFFNRLEESLDDISKSLKQILDKENAKHLKDTLKNIDQISELISKDLPTIITDFKHGIHKFEKMAHDMSEAGNEFSITMKAGKRSIDQISQQTIPSISKLVRRMNDIAANLEQVSVQMRQNPAVIIRGNTPPKPGPGEH